MGWSAGAWAYRLGPLRTSAAGAPLAAGAFTTSQAATPGMHGAALRVPGGRPPWGGSHQRRDAVACRTSPLVDIGRRHCACRQGTLVPGGTGVGWRAVWWLRAPTPPAGRYAPVLAFPVKTRKYRTCSNAINPTATLVEPTPQTQGVMSVLEAAFPRYLRP